MWGKCFDSSWLLTVVCFVLLGCRKVLILEISCCGCGVGDNCRDLEARIGGHLSLCWKWWKRLCCDGVYQAARFCLD